MQRKVLQAQATEIDAIKVIIANFNGAMNAIKLTFDEIVDKTELIVEVKKAISDFKNNLNTPELTAFIAPENVQNAIDKLGGLLKTFKNVPALAIIKNNKKSLVLLPKYKKAFRKANRIINWFLNEWINKLPLQLKRGGHDLSEVLLKVKPKKRNK